MGKPVAKFSGQDGNIFGLIAIASRALKNSGKEDFNVEVWDEDIMEEGGFIDEAEAQEAEENDKRMSEEFETLRTIY